MLVYQRVLINVHHLTLGWLRNSSQASDFEERQKLRLEERTSCWLSQSWGERSARKKRGEVNPTYAYIIQLTYTKTMILVILG